MSNIKELVKSNIEQIKKLLFEEQKAEFAEAELVDGTKVIVKPTIESGAEVYVVSEAGEVLAPDGEHQLADGTIIVTVEGKISEIKEAEDLEKEEKKVEEEVENQFAEIAKGINEKIAEITKSFTEQVTALQGELNSEREKFEAAKKESEAKEQTNEQFKKQVFDLLNKIADMPAPEATPQKFNQTKKTENVKDEVENFVESYLNRTNK
jgi:hypothetical protein